MRDEARAYFNETLGLTYSDIKQGDLLMLAMFLKEELKSTKGSLTVAPMRLSQKIRSEYEADGTLIWCELYVNSHYFRQRECITFNQGGFVGFCGWGTDEYAKPIVTAFKKWCIYLTESR